MREVIPYMAQLSDIDSFKLECSKKYSDCENLLVLLFNYFPNERESLITRHFIASEGSVEKCIKHIERMQLWRQQSFPFTVYPFDSNTKIPVFYTFGLDSLNHPLIIFRSTLSNVKTRNIEEMVRLLIFNIEVALKRLPENVLQISMLMDREGMKFGPDYEFYRRFGDLLSCYYPCLMYRVFIYPVNYAVRTMWDIAKQLLPSRAKVVVQPISTLDKLRQVIPDSYIPMHLGGSCTYQFNAEDYPNPFLEPKSKYVPKEYNNTATAPELTEEAVEQLYNDMYANDENPSYINQESVARSYNYNYMRQVYFGTDAANINANSNSTAKLDKMEEDDAWSEVNY